MHLTSHITHSNGYAPYIAYYRSNGFDQLFRKLKPKPKLNPPNAHRSKFAKIGTRKMCSFGSCQTRFEFLSQFRKVRNAFECFVTQVQTRLPKTKCVWPMKINVICTVSALARFRCSNHHLAIETQHGKTVREHRFCKFCVNLNIREIRDEFHFLMGMPSL